MSTYLKYLLKKHKIPSDELNLTEEEYKGKYGRYRTYQEKEFIKLIKRLIEIDESYEAIIDLELKNGKATK
jgi:hypothetical protein